MAKLNDTQRTILSAAAARDDLRVLPLPEALRAPAHIVKKTVSALIEAGLIAEITALPDDTAWTASDAGGWIALVVTTSGLAAIGINTEAAPVGVAPDESSTSGKGRGGGETRANSAKPAARASTGDGGAKVSKQDIVLALLRRPEGASIADMVAATGWQQHSVRGFMSGALKRRLGLEVISEKDVTGERRYHVAGLKARHD